MILEIQELEAAIVEACRQMGCYTKERRPGSWVAWAGAYLAEGRTEQEAAARLVEDIRSFRFNPPLADATQVYRGREPFGQSPKI